MNGPCQAYQDMIVDDVLGLLDRQHQEALSRHSASCPACKAYREALENEKQLLSAWINEFDHRLPDRIDQCIATLEQTVSTPKTRQIPWRKIMLMPITKIAVAAVVVVAIAATIILQPGPVDTLPTLLSTVCAAEDALFTGTQIVYIRNETTIFPTEAFQETGYSWLPMCSLKADGQFRFDQLRLALEEKPYTITDQAWYDPPTGRFVRLLETDGQVVFANSYDGEFVYTPQTESDGRQIIAKQLVAQEFQPPARPADFFGLAAGLRSGLQEDNTDVIEVTSGTLDDGTPVQIFKVGTPDPNGQLHAYWLFKVKEDDHTVAEEVFVINGQMHIVIRRVATEAITKADIDWDLSTLSVRLDQVSASQRATVTPDMVIPDISIERMIERANFTTYVFSQQPPWTSSCQIMDVFDPASLGQRMFIFACPAEDGRHIVLVQSPTYNAMLGQIIGQVEPMYESLNGFKVIGGEGARSKWLANILLQSARAAIKDNPSEDRIGFILQSPAGTYPALAINGTVSEEELHALIDSLMPAKDYLNTIEESQ